MRIKCFNQKMRVALVLFSALCNPLTAQNMENELSKREFSHLSVIPNPEKTKIHGWKP